MVAVFFENRLSLQRVFGMLYYSLGEAMLKYLKQLNRQTEVHSKTIEIINKPIYQYFDDLLVPALTTFKGRINATKRMYHYHKLTPLYISSACLLMPTNNKRSLDNIYINLYSIKTVVNINGETLIKFQDNDTLLLANSYKQFMKLITRARNITAPIN